MIENNLDIMSFKYYLKQQNYAHNTIASYVYDIGKLEKATTNKKLSLITIEEFKAFLDQENKENLCDSSKRRMLSVLKLFYSFFNRKDILQVIDNYFINYTNVTHASKTILSSKDIDTLLNVIDLNSLYGPRNYLLISFLYFFVLKIEDVVSLKVGDISDTKFLTRLTVHKILDFPIHLNLVLNKYIKDKDKDEFLFKSKQGNKLHRKSAWRIVRELGKEVHLDINTDIFRQSRLHQLRNCIPITYYKQIVHIRKQRLADGYQRNTQ